MHQKNHQDTSKRKLDFRTLRYCNRILGAGDICLGELIGSKDAGHDIFLSEIKRMLNALYQQFGAAEVRTRSMLLHSRTLAAQYRDAFATTRRSPLISHDTCFTCLFSIPVHVLHCGHVLCKECIMRFGRTTEKLVDYVEIQHCPLCQSSESTMVKVPSPMAGMRVLSLDG